MMMFTFVLALLRLIRIHAGIAAAVLALISALLTEAVLAPSIFALLAVAVLSTTSAGNALNDVYDCEIDRVSKPNRPVPSGMISAGAAIATAVMLFALAIACSAFISRWCLALCVINVIVLIAYAKHSKKIGFLKALLVGYLVGSVTLFGATRLDLLNLPIVTLAACAILATISRELIKDIEDKVGDASCDARTFPIVMGDRATYTVAYACLAAAVAVAFIPYYTADMANTYAALICIGGAVFFGSLLFAHARMRQVLVMTGSLIVMAAFYVGKL